MFVNRRAVDGQGQAVLRLKPSANIDSQSLLALDATERLPVQLDIRHRVDSFHHQPHRLSVDSSGSAEWAHVEDASAEIAQQRCPRSNRVELPAWGKLSAIRSLISALAIELDTDAFGCPASARERRNGPWAAKMNRVNCQVSKAACCAVILG